MGGGCFCTFSQNKSLFALDKLSFLSFSSPSATLQAATSLQSPPSAKLNSATLRHRLDRSVPSAFLLSPSYLSHVLFFLKKKRLKERKVLVRTWSFEFLYTIRKLILNVNWDFENFFGIIQNSLKNGFRTYNFSAPNVWTIHMWIQKPFFGLITIVRTGPTQIVFLFSVFFLCVCGFLSF